MKKELSEIIKNEIKEKLDITINGEVVGTTNNALSTFRYNFYNDIRKKLENETKEILKSEGKIEIDFAGKFLLTNSKDFEEFLSTVKFYIGDNYMKEIKSGNRKYRAFLENGEIVRIESENVSLAFKKNERTMKTETGYKKTDLTEFEIISHDILDTAILCKKFDDLKFEKRSETFSEVMGFIEGNENVSLSIEKSNDTIKTETGYRRVNFSEVKINCRDMVDSAVLCKKIDALKFKKNSEMFSEVTKVLRKILKEKLPKHLTNDIKYAEFFEKYENEKDATLESLFAFTVVYDDVVCIDFETLKRIVKENKGPRLHFMVETEIMGKRVEVKFFKNGIVEFIPQDRSSETISNFLKMFEYLKDFSNAGYVVTILLKGDGEGLKLTGEKDFISVVKNNYLKSDLQKLKKFSQKTGKEIKFSILNEVCTFIIKGDKLFVEEIGYKNVMRNYREDLIEIFSEIEKISKRKCLN
jgi:hypothetical protein